MPSLLSPTLSLSSSHIFSFLNVHPTSMILPPIHPSISSYIHFSSYASIYQFIHPFFILPSIYQFIHPFSSYPSIYQFIHPFSSYPSIYQFIHPFFLLFIHLSIYLSSKMHQLPSQFTELNPQVLITKVGGEWVKLVLI